MPNTPAGMRECPTRVDGTTALFAHVIDTASCQTRQRQHYHKCPTCSFCNARIGLAPAPTNGVNGHAQPRARRLPPLEPPVRRALQQVAPPTNGRVNGHVNGHAPVSRAANGVAH